VRPPPLTPLAAAVLHVPAPERALEIECREGDGVLFLAREFPTARVRGVDRSAEAVRGAVGRIGLDPEGRVAFKRGKPRALPYPDRMFDLVAQQRGALHPNEVIRVLRPGGHLVYVERPRLPLLRPHPRALARGLRRRGLEQVHSAEAAGLQFHVWRLPEDRAAHE
jgi:ubiquinone/menaquinone biosynthesis C-methylase UbiE